MLKLFKQRKPIKRQRREFEFRIYLRVRVLCKYHRSLQFRRDLSKLQKQKRKYRSQLSSLGSLIILYP